MTKRDEIIQAQAQGRLRSDITWHVAPSPAEWPRRAKGVLKELTEMVERKKARSRARVEHPFHIVKNLFGHKKVSYKGLAKNRARTFSLFALANLIIAKRSLMGAARASAS